MTTPPPLIHALLDPAAYPHAADGVRLIETHISWVLIAGEHAYKIKKPVDLGFVDFSTLARRRFCCDEELRLNRRLAAKTYLEVVAITGTQAAPQIGGTGDVLEWAVHMRAFPADATLDREAQAHPPRVTAAQIDAIADCVARFHREIDPAPADSPYGEPATVMQPVRENFTQIGGLQPSDADRALLRRLAAWSEATGERLAGHFTARKAAGFVRECHGDLHLGNIAWVDETPLIFDCIEFNPALRFIDVISELAFLFMDLISRGLEGLAWRALNRYLEHSGDYAGLAALRFYAVYRAMVRAKVCSIRAAQDGADPQAAAAQRAEARRYLLLAERLGQARRPALLLMHGVTGSGKSTLSQQVLEALGAVRLRSDVARKRLFGLGPLERSDRVPGGIYNDDASRRTFDGMAATARQLLGDGFRVIVDATFLRRPHRQPFADLARELGVPWCILSLEADVELLRERVRERARRRDDVSEADLEVLEAQLAGRDPLDDGERGHAWVFAAGESAAWPAAIAEVRKALGEAG